MRALRRARQVPRVGDIEEQAQIHEVEMHDEGLRGSAVGARKTKANLNRA
jgi:hypothetical protein